MTIFSRQSTYNKQHKPANMRYKLLFVQGYGMISPYSWYGKEDSRVSYGYRKGGILHARTGWRNSSVKTRERDEVASSGQAAGIQGRWLVAYQQRRTSTAYAEKQKCISFEIRPGELISSVVTHPVAIAWNPLTAGREQLPPCVYYSWLRNANQHRTTQVHNRQWVAWEGISL